MESNHGRPDETTGGSTGAGVPSGIPAPLSRVDELTATAASTTHFSPELLEAIQKERINCMLRLALMLRHSVASGGVDSLQIGQQPASSLLSTSLSQPQQRHPIASSAQDPTPVWLAHLLATTPSRNAPFCAWNQTILPHPWNLQQQPEATHDHISLPQQHVHVHAIHPSLMTEQEGGKALTTGSIAPSSEARGKKLQGVKHNSLSTGSLPTNKQQPSACESEKSCRSRIQDIPEQSARTSVTNGKPRGCVAKKRKASHPSPAASENESSSPSVSHRSAKRRRYRIETFPSKLLRLMDTAKLEGKEHLISFTADGTAVSMPSPKELAEQILPNIFRHKKFPSLLRQLSMYGFVRIHAGTSNGCLLPTNASLLLTGPNKGAYAHPFFLRGRPELIRHIRRTIDLELDQPANDDETPHPVERTPGIS